MNQIRDTGGGLQTLAGRWSRSHEFRIRVTDHE